MKWLIQVQYYTDSNTTGDGLTGHLIVKTLDNNMTHALCLAAEEVLHLQVRSVEVLSGFDMFQSDETIQQSVEEPNFLN